MTTPQTPPCDLCGNEPSIISVMQYSDWSQLLVGPNCLLPWVQGMLGMLTGQAEGDTDDQDPEAAPPTGEASEPHTEPTEPPGGSSAAPPPRPKRAARAAT